MMCVETCGNVYHIWAVFRGNEWGLGCILRDMAGNQVMRLTFKWAYNAVESN